MTSVWSRQDLASGQRVRQCRPARNVVSRRGGLRVRASVGQDNKPGTPTTHLSSPTALSSKDVAMLSEVQLKQMFGQEPCDTKASAAKYPPIRQPASLTSTDIPSWPPKRPFAAIAVDNAWDSVNDILRHVRRMNLPLPTQTALGRLVNQGGGIMRLETAKKPVVLVLGTGWGAHSLIKVIDTDTYDVICISPRNHFVFTPMLPSTAVGTVEFRSLLEPIRTSNPFVSYFEAACDTLDLNTKTAYCTSSFTFEDGRRPQFEVPYDILVVAVGEQPATFGVPGVGEFCFFMKEIKDCVELRGRIGEQFELCSLPGTTEEDREKNLHFVVVGGGPTGVEFAGTLCDFVRGDLKKKYPELMKYVKVTLLQSAQSILSTFQESLQQQALENLTQEGVSVRTGVRVVEITRDQVVLKDGDRLDYGICVWSTGNAARPLVRDLVSALPQQKHFQASSNPATVKLAVDPFLRVIGARDVLALGDCSLVVGNRLPATAQVAAQQGSYLAHLINRQVTLGVGGMYKVPPYRTLERSLGQPLSPSLSYIKDLLAGGKERVELGGEIYAEMAALEEPPWAQAARAASLSFAMGTLPDDEEDNGSSGGPKAEDQNGAANGDGSGGSSAAAAAVGRTAVVAAATALAVEQQTDGKKPFPPNGSDKINALDFQTRPFEFLSLGIMAYVGNDKALTQFEAFDTLRLNLYGSFAFLLWRSVYITKQVSFRNRVLILFDWLKTKVFGRDLSLF